jgi:hypothetical protein
LDEQFLAILYTLAAELWKTKLLFPRNQRRVNTNSLYKALVMTSNYATN